MKKSSAQRMIAISGFGFDLINLGTTIEQIYRERTFHLAQARLLVTVAGAIVVYFSADDERSPSNKFARRDAQPKRRGPALVAALESGAFGGLVGGILGGLPFVLYYYFSALAPTPFLVAIGLIAEGVVYAITVGLIIGLLVELSIYAARKYLGEPYRPIKEMAAGLVGGVAAGLITGLIGGGRFALREADPISFGWLMGWLAFGVAWIAAGSLLLENDLRGRGARALAIVAGTAFLSMFGGLLLLESTGIDLNKIKGTEMALRVGAEIGVICAAVAGLQIAGSQVAYRLLVPEIAPPKKQKERKRKGRNKEVRPRR